MFLCNIFIKITGKHPQSSPFDWNCRLWASNIFKKTPSQLVFSYFYEIHQIRYSIAHPLITALDSRESSLVHVYMRPEVNSDRFEISLRCKITSLSAFTWLRAEWKSLLCKFHFGQFDRSEISNRSEFSM